MTNIHIIMMYLSIAYAQDEWNGGYLYAAIVDWDFTTPQDISKCSDKNFICTISEYDIHKCNVGLQNGNDVQIALYSDAVKNPPRVLSYPFIKFRFDGVRWEKKECGYDTCTFHYVKYPYYCWQYKPTDAGWPHVAPNGIYAVDYPSFLTMGSVKYLSTFIPWESCHAGTWLTCKNKPPCYWNVPFEQVDWVVPAVPIINYPYKDTNVDISEYIPVRHCFPCISGMSMTHYDFEGNTECTGNLAIDSSTCKSKIFGILSDAEKAKRVFCPGGTYPPMYCPLGYSANEARTACVCPPGKINSGNAVCVDCPVAHYCPDGVSAKICDDGYYQDKTGQSACLLCALPGGYPFSCSRAGDVPANCTKGNDPVGLSFLISPRCVPCLNCKNSIIQAEEAKGVLQTGVSKTYYDCLGDLF